MRRSNQVLRLLNSLGNTKDEVAASLKERNITGYPGVGQSCPIAMFVKSAADTDYCSAGDEHIYFDFGYSVETPEAIGEFIISFDEGKYPELKA